MICRIYDVPGGTLAQYDEVSQKMEGNVGNDTPEGVHAHIAGATDGGIRVIEVWDSAAQADRFDQESGLGEAMQEVGVPEPTITEFEVHNLDWLRP